MKNMRWLVPEVVQTSNMDCGPASLKCLLEGFGIKAHYGHLRDACQTDVDGTSINTLEKIAVELGLDAVQMVVPVDHLLLDTPDYLPGLVVVRLPNGNTHFVVAWRKHGGLVQVMDPASGRRWPSVRQFLDELHIHTMRVPPAAWRNWAGSDDFINPLRERIKKLGIADKLSFELCESTIQKGDWHSLAFFDATVRMLSNLVYSKAIRRGQEAADLLSSFITKYDRNPSLADDLVPENYWCVRPYAPPGSTEELQFNSAPAELAFQGAVIVSVRGVKEAREEKLKYEVLDKALKEPSINPLTQLWSFIKEDGILAPITVVLAMLVAVFGLMSEALLFRGLIDIHSELGTEIQRAGAMGLALFFMLTIVLVQFPAAKIQLILGRHLENRFRMRFLKALPNLPDHFFQSRPISDTAERSHRISALRDLPVLGGSILFTVMSLAATGIGIIWLAPQLAPLIILMTVLQVFIPLCFQPILSDHSMRVQTHSGALARFYMDALLGVVPIRTHGAIESVRREHESLLTEWMNAGYLNLRIQLSSQAVQLIVNSILACLLVVLCIKTKGSSPDLLLLIYWVLALPPLGQEVAVLMREYPRQRNVLLRALEPLQASYKKKNSSTEDEGPVKIDNAVRLKISDVSVKLNSKDVLQGINLEVNPGEHVAIVGASGAGKSSLVGLLLGWLKPSSGRILINGVELTDDLQEQFRLNCAWVDPSVHLWNSSLLDNLSYGNENSKPLYPILNQADLLKLVATLPDGLQSSLGEGGALVSGGEGQRVRLARALGRENVCCVILDEPFRGLDREQRQNMLVRIRQFWSETTLLCITHDISETKKFSRVLVVNDGRIVEDGSPDELISKVDSRYGQLLGAEKSLWRDCWESNEWRHLSIQGGEVHEKQFLERKRVLNSGGQSREVENEF
ncbi:ATP-binding cassette domain-containing protein [Microbulbifer sp. TRSA002]|uniref:ATP-binding cassette domain-containing protein n=1 Tax=Microbulbifer sp. TRSA002 TaxID=3243382 RepID=UPI00403A06A0